MVAQLLEERRGDIEGIIKVLGLKRGVEIIWKDLQKDHTCMSEVERADNDSCTLESLRERTNLS